MSPDDRIRIDWDDIRKAESEKSLPPREMGKSWGSVQPQPTSQNGSQRAGSYGRTLAPETAPGVQRLLYSSALYTCLAGAAGAFLAWLVFEPFVDDLPGKTSVMQLLWLPITGALVGLAVGSIEGLVSHSFGKAAVGGSVGLGIGAVGAGVSLVIGEIVYRLLGGGQLDTPLPLQILARSLGWAAAGMFLGLGQGVALLSWKKLLNGFLGGLAGGFLGGLFFDPVSFVTQSGELSRLVGVVMVGTMVGLMTALAEQLTKDAWLHVAKGHLAGKQFVIYRNPTIIGSSPKSDIYLFKDPDVEPRHAAISNDGRTYTIEDYGTPAGTFVNGERVSRQPLRGGDTIQIGGTTFAYSERVARKRG